MTYSLPQLPLFPLLHGGEVVDRRVLYHRQEDEDEADPEVDVHRLDVGDPRHGSVDPRDDGGHGQHRGDACGSTRRGSHDTGEITASYSGVLQQVMCFLRQSHDDRHLFERTAWTCCFILFFHLPFNTIKEIKKHIYIYLYIYGATR